jgi:uncharacterized protein (DUF1778 family)
MPTRDRPTQHSPTSPTAAQQLRVTITVGFPADAGAEVTRAAKQLHKKVGPFVRDAAIEVAHRVLGIAPDTARST